MNVPNYPIQLEPNTNSQVVSERELRPSSTRKWNQDVKFQAAKECFSRNAAKIWNSAPIDIINAKTLTATRLKSKNTANLSQYNLTWPG